MITSRADMRDSVAGSTYLLRYLRVCLSLESSSLVRLSAQLLGNFALVAAFRDALANEFNVADLLVGMLAASVAAGDALLVQCTASALANISQHPFMASQLLIPDRLERLLQCCETVPLWTATVLANAAAVADAFCLDGVSEVLLAHAEGKASRETAAEHARLVLLVCHKVPQAAKTAKLRGTAGILAKLGNGEAGLYVAALRVLLEERRGSKSETETKE